MDALAFCLPEILGFALLLVGIGLFADYLESQEEPVRHRYGDRA